MGNDTRVRNYFGRLGDHEPTCDNIETGPYTAVFWKNHFPVQFVCKVRRTDGEPWLDAAGDLIITEEHAPLLARMTRRSLKRLVRLRWRMFVRSK